ncbi:MAG TPA: DEAD/DEAH box helicase, partial [Myxococcaceae bacterium]|nr:DEAD/DEAH box helicase [Myxococcaceae bacterium]
AVFPAQVGCQDNHGNADVELPDQPLVRQTMDDCLREAMDVDGLKAVLRRLKAGEIRTVAVDLPEPSPLAHALLNSQPYTFLDDAPLEERRARAVQVRRSLPAEDAAQMGALDADAIHQVVSDARLPVRDPDELHELLLQGVLVPAEGLEPAFLDVLVAAGRAARLGLGDRSFAVAAERVPHVRALFPGAALDPPLEPLAGDGPVDREAAVLAAVRGRMEVAGPLTATGLALALALEAAEVTAALHQLESEGTVLRGRFRPSQPADGELEWCDRRLLQRIHRLTVGRLRREIEPLSSADFMRFLFRWHHLGAGDSLRGKNGLLRAVSLLEGVEAPAAGWEQALFPARVQGDVGKLLEEACWGGEVVWGRLTLREPRPPGPRRGAEVEAPARRAPGMTRAATLSFFRRSSMDALLAAARPDLSADGEPWLPEDLEGAALDVGRALIRRGACFFADLIATTRREPGEVEDALWELLARGVVTADAVDNLRILQSPKRRRQQRALKRGGPGRWTLLLPTRAPPAEERNRALAELFLRRWGVVFRDLVAREPLAPPWRILAGLYRRMEARGELRGGRFVAGVAGEQFALPEAVDAARAIRRARPGVERVELSAVDPLNLTGIVTPGPRVPALLGERVVYVDGVPAAAPAAVESSAADPA